MTQPSDAQSFLDLARYVQAPQESPAITAKKAQVSQTSQAKQAQLPEASTMKQAIYGTPEEQRVIATAWEQGIKAVTDDEMMRDMDQLDKLAFAAKYGADAALDRAKFYNAQADLDAFKSRDRGSNQATKDNLLKAAAGFTRVAGSTLAGAAALKDGGERLVTSAVDAITGAEPGEGRVAPDPMSPGMTEMTRAAADFIASGESQLAKDRAAQHALEDSLLRAENETEYQAALEAAMNEEGAWDRVVKPWLQKQGSEIADTVRNYADDPIMLQGMGAEGVGSLAAVAAGGAALKAGRLGTTALMGGSESGAAVSQAQEEILGMSEEQLMESPDYVAMRKQGASHEKARNELAAQVGGRAGLAALPLALGAGYVAAPVAMTPFKAPGTGLGRAVGLGQNMAREGIEEFIQEGNTQLVTNESMRDAGFDVALDRDVAAAATQGAMGGIMASGAMAAPSTALGAAAAGLNATGKALGGAKDRVEARREAARDAASPVGSNAQAQSRAKFDEAGEALLTNRSNQLEPNQDEATSETTPQREPGAIDTSVRGALYLDETEIESTLQAYPELAEQVQTNEDGSRVLKRSAMLDSVGKQLSNKETPAIDKIYGAIDVMVSYDKLRNVDSDVARSEIESLPEDSADRQAYEAMSQELKTMESSPVLARSAEILKSITPELVTQMVPVDVLTSEETPASVKTGLKDTLKSIVRVNPLAVDQSIYNAALAQSGNTGATGSNDFIARIQAGKAVAESFLKAKTEKEKIGADQKADYKTTDIFNDRITMDTVREDVATGGNRNNGLPSLMEHRKNVMDAALAGRTQNAQDALDGLFEFARSQVNKIAAFNQSTEEGKGKQSLVPFESWNGTRRFKQKGVWVDIRNPWSVAQAREAHVDAQSAVDLAKTLATEHGLSLSEDLTVPSLHENITGAKGLAPKTETASDTKTSDRGTASAAPAPTPSGSSDQTSNEASSEMEKDALLSAEFAFDEVLEKGANGNFGGYPVTENDAETVKGAAEAAARGDVAAPFIKGDRRRQGIAVTAFNIARKSMIEAGYAGEYSADPAPSEDQALADMVQKSEPKREIGVLTEDQKAQVTEVMDLVSKALGIDVSKLIKGVVSYRNPENPKNTGFAWWHNKKRWGFEETVIGLDPVIFEDERQLKEVLVHEIAHAIDSAAQGKTRFMPSDNAFLHEGGKVTNEIREVSQDSRAIEDWFSWVWSFDKQKQRASEIFAQLGAVFMLNRDYAERMLPNGSEFFKTVAARIGAKFDQASDDSSEQDSDQTGTDASTEGTGEGSDARASEVSVADQAVTGDAVTPWLEGLAALLPKDSNGENIALRAFRPKTGGSTLVAHSDPVAFLLGSLKSLVSPDNAMKEELGEEQQNAVADLLRDPWTQFKKAYTDGLNALIKKRDESATRLNAQKKNGISNRKLWSEMLDAGQVDEILSYESGMTLNFVSGKDGDTFLTEERVLAATYMAAMEWLITNANRGLPRLDNEAISKLFGMGRNGKVTREMRNQARYGIPLQSALEDIDRRIQDLLGLRKNDDVPLNETQGMFRAMAANALEVLMEMPADGQRKGDWIQAQTMDYQVKNERTGEMEPRKMTSIRVNPDYAKDDTIKALQKMGTPFSQAFLPGYQKERLIGEPARRVEDTQLGNKFSKISEKAFKVIKRLQGAPSYINSPLLDLVDFMGDEAYLKSLGWVEVTEDLKKRLNKNDLASIEGKNLSLERGLRESRLYAEEAGDQPIYFRWRLSSVGRLQQEGPVTPQGDKTARELISATNSVLNLNDEAHVQALWLAIAQSIDISVEKLSLEEAITQAQDAMKEGGPLHAAVELTRMWLQDAENQQDELCTLMLAALENSGMEITPKLIHAVLTAARAKEAEGTAEASQFKTALALEADGKTDGPVNAMIHLATTVFDPAEIERWAKGGLFFTSQSVSLNDFIASEHERSKGKKTKAEDLYHLAAAKFKETLIGALGSKIDDVLPIMTLLDVFLPDFTLGKPNAKGEYDPRIERNLVKNPLTVFLYGAGPKGISNKLTNAMTEVLYKTLSEIAAAKVDGDLKSWRDHKTFKANPGLEQALTDIVFGGDKAKLDKFFSNPVEAELSQFEFDALSKAVQDSFANPMLDAVDEVTGGLVTNMKTLQKASQVQTLIFQDLHEQQQQAQNDANTVETASGKTRKILPSARAMDENFSSQMMIAPTYETEDQSFHIASPEKASGTDRVSQSFKGRLSARATMIRPSDASVKISPYLTIGTGDGQMMLNIYATVLEALDRSLAVFDGVEMALDAIKEMSAAINKAVWDGWMGTNVYASARQGYGQMTERLTQELFDSLSDKTKAELRRALGWPKDAPLPNLESILAIQDDLQDLENKVEDRKAAMKQMATSTDHMAAAQSPHLNEGITTRFDNPLHYKAIARRLNQLMVQARKAREKTQKEKQKARSKQVANYAQAPSKELTAAIQRVGNKLEGHPGVTWVTGATLLRLLTEKNGATPSQKMVMEKMMKDDGLFRETAYYFGSSAELEAARDDYFPDLGSDAIELGLSYVGSNVAFISNIAPETILHEMLHVRTYRLLVDRYADVDSVPEHVVHATNQLEELVGEVMVLVPQNEAMRVLQDELRRLENDKPQQLTELIAYVLTNQDITETTQNQNSYGGLLKIIRAGMARIQRLLGFRRSELPDNRIWNRVRFSTQVLVAEQRDNLTSDRGQVNKALRQAYGDNSRLDWVEERFVTRMGAYLDARVAKQRAELADADVNDEAIRTTTYAEGAELRKRGMDAANRAVSNGFRMDPREQTAFSAVHATMSSGIRFDAALLRQAEALHNYVIKTLTPEALVEAGATQAEAGLMHGFLTGPRGFLKQSNGRSDVLAGFMALAQVNPVLREALAKMPPKKEVSELSWGSMDEIVDSLGSLAVMLLTRLSLRKPERTGTVGRELDRLTHAMGEIEGERRYLAALSQLSERMDWANEGLARGIKKSSDKATRWLMEKHKSSGTRVGRLSFDMASYVAAIGSKEASAAKGEALTTMLNHTRGWNELRALLSDMRGLTDTNAPLIRLINPVKARIDQMRQDFREGVPRSLTKAFSRKLTRDEWSQLHKLGQADVMALGLVEARALIADPASLKGRIASAEETIQSLAPKLADRYKAKAKALAGYIMGERNTSANLLRSGHAIAHLFGEQGAMKPGDADQKVVDAIDRLVALYAYEKTDQGTKDLMQTLSETEATGMEMITGILSSMRALEKEKTLSDDPDEAGIALNNAWSGWLPSLTDPDAQVRVFEDIEGAELKKTGWTRIGDYEGDRAESHLTRRGYYISNVAGRSAFRQGVALSVHASYSGVNAMTGMSLEGTAGALKGPRVTRLARQVQGMDPTRIDNRAPGDHLMPVLDAKGQVIAYERPMDPKMLEGLQKDQHMGRMLGVWMGRVFEEQAANAYNRTLVETLKEIHDKAIQEGRASEFVNVAKSDDPVIQDAWDTLGFQIRADAEEIFERPKYLPVMRSMVNDAVGYRRASLTDAWTMPKKSPDRVEGLPDVYDALASKGQKAFQDLVTLMAGDKAYGYLRKAEKGVQNLVSYAKTTIIVRSIIVGTGNIASNVLHLMAKGINPIKIGVEGRKKFLEIRDYVRNMEQIQELQLEYAAKAQNQKEARRIEARVQALTDANARLSIMPLIEAGEFSTISEDLNEADQAFRDGKWAEYMEKAVDKLPGWGPTVAKNLLITKDTALFKGLNRMVQYGDFVAKAVLYDHLLEKGMSERQALDEIMEEFVQYNRLPGRGRDYLESMGLLWFMNYALRIQKIVVKTARERPLTALMMMSQVGPASGVDSVASGSLLGKFMDGSLDYSVGWGMGLNAPYLNPVLNASN